LEAWTQEPIAPPTEAEMPQLSLAAKGAETESNMLGLTPTPGGSGSGLFKRPQIPPAAAGGPGSGTALGKSGDSGTGLAKSASGSGAFRRPQLAPAAGGSGTALGKAASDSAARLEQPASQPTSKPASSPRALRPNPALEPPPTTPSGGFGSMLGVIVLSVLVTLLIGGGIGGIAVWYFFLRGK
jgi:hypothetical protein